MKYIKSLHLINFQSHQNTWLELDPGLNIFVGESDQGKTAIIRALRWLFYNEPRGTGFIRVGETRCEVTAILSDETKVTRLRDETKRQNRYVINYPDGREMILEKFKNEVPLEVQQELGVYPLWIDTDQKLELNIARQLDSPFLIAESPANRAKIIGRIANLHIIDAAQRELLKDIRNQSRQKADLEVDIEKLEAEKEEYEDLPAQEQQLHQVKKYLDNIQSLKTLSSQLAELSQQKAELHRNILKNNEELAKLQNIEEITQLYEQYVKTAAHHRELIKLQDTLRSVKTELDKHNYTINNLRELETAANIAQQLIELSAVSSELGQIKSQLNQGQTKLHQINNYLKATNQLADADQIITKLYDLRHQGFELQQLKRVSRQLKADITSKEADLVIINEKLEKLRDLDKAQTILANQLNNVNDCHKLSELNLQYKIIQNQVQEKFMEIAKRDSNYRKIQQEFIAILSKAGTCPTCGSRITPMVIEEIADNTAI